MVESAAVLCCPECGSRRLYRDGFRYLENEEMVQRWLCRDCCFRFSHWTKTSKTLRVKHSISESALPSSDLATKNLLKAMVLTVATGSTTSGLAGATTDAADIRGKILAYLMHLKKKGLKEITVRTYISNLNQLQRAGIDLTRPEEVKEFIANNNKWGIRSKEIIVIIYADFLKWLGIIWEPPRYKPTRKLPFMPTEEEIDQLIARAGRRLAPFLQLLKETGMRRGEAAMLKWTDVDFKRRTVTVTPEKNSNPRILPLSEKAIGMLDIMPRRSDRIFASLSSLTSNFYMQRKTLTRKLSNPRILKICLHSFRHWKATSEYHKTKDILHVQQVLGHADIKSTMMYINIEQALYATSSDEFHVKTAKTAEEACKLAEVGFEYFDEIEGLHLYRKRK